MNTDTYNLTKYNKIW